MIKKITSSKAFYLIISFVAAVCLWMYVVGVVNPLEETEIRNIPVTFVGEEAILEDYSLVISQGGDSTVSLKAYGKRADILKLNRNNITATVDLSSVKSDGEVSLGYELTFPEDVNPDDFTYIERENIYVFLTIEKLETKPVEIRGVLAEDSTIAEGYVAESFIFQPETVNIMGSAEKLATVSHALVTVNRTNISKTITDNLSYQLISYEGEVIEDDSITLLTDTIAVTLPIAKTKDVPLVIEVIDGGGATASNLIRTIEPSSITISGDAEVVDGVSQIILTTIDLSELTSQQTIECPIVIPNDAKNLSGVETATVTVKLSGLDTKTLDASQIEFINKPESYNAIAITQSVTVIIRAAVAEIDSITENNVRLVANLEAINTVGRYELDAKVYVDGNETAGALGDYKVVVYITEKANDGATSTTGGTALGGSTATAAITGGAE